MLRVSRGMTPGALYGHDHARTWVWSDLHLGHTKTIEAFRRPFGTADEMNDTIFRNWEQVVAPADTILILGDVTVHGLWGRRLARVRQAPGRKILVYGNHEITSTGLVETNGFDEVHSSLYVEGDPPLLLTHVPLRVVPESCVNIHGHLTSHTRAGEDETHQRLRRATPVPTKGPLGASEARPAPRKGRDRARAHDRRQTGSDRLKRLSPAGAKARRQAETHSLHQPIVGYSVGSRSSSNSKPLRFSILQASPPQRGLRRRRERSWRGLTGPGRTGRRRTRSGSLRRTRTRRSQR